MALPLLSLLSLVIAHIATGTTVKQAIDAATNDEIYFQKVTDANFARYAPFGLLITLS